MPKPERETDPNAIDQPAEQSPLYADAATRVSKPSRFDEWYYGIEDKIGQGAVGMAVCLIMFVVILAVAILFKPI